MALQPKETSSSCIDCRLRNWKVRVDVFAPGGAYLDATRMVLTENGDVYGWGQNVRGSVGVEAHLTYTHHRLFLNLNSSVSLLLQEPLPAHLTTTITTWLYVTTILKIE